jgi:hypothetical protein
MCRMGSHSQTLYFGNAMFNNVSSMQFGDHKVILVRDQNIENLTNIQ